MSDLQSFDKSIHSIRSQTSFGTMTSKRDISGRALQNFGKDNETFTSCRGKQFVGDKAFIIIAMEALHGFFS